MVEKPAIVTLAQDLLLARNPELKQPVMHAAFNHASWIGANTFSSRAGILKRSMKGAERTESSVVQASLDHVREHGTRVNGKPWIDAFGETGATASPIDHSIDMGLAEMRDQPTFNQFLSHEVKHTSQFKREPDSFGWYTMGQDVQRSLKTGQYELKDRYTLLDVPSSAALRTVIELDATAFGDLALYESNPNMHAGDRQLFVDNSANTLLKGGSWQLRGAAFQDQDTGALHRLSNDLDKIAARHGRKPEIEWTGITNDRLRGLTTGLWDKAGLAAPMRLSGGVDPIDNVRKSVDANPHVKTTATRVRSTFGGPR